MKIYFISVFSISLNINLVRKKKNLQQCKINVKRIQVNKSESINFGSNASYIYMYSYCCHERNKTFHFVILFVLNHHFKCFMLIYSEKKIEFTCVHTQHIYTMTSITPQYIDYFDIKLVI